MKDHVLYEHPLHETLRVSLRLECLFAQSDHRLTQQGYWDDRAIVATLVDIVNILDRPDYKTKLSKKLIDSKENLSQHLDAEKVDQEKLQSILQQFNSSIEYLNSVNGKLNQDLEKNEFFNNVRQRLGKTGGARNFDLPMYHFWLSTTEKNRRADIDQWFKQIAQVRQAVQLYLKVVRDSTTFDRFTAEKGFFEKDLTATTEYQLVRIYLKNNSKFFPDISIGRHRMSLHFFSMDNVNERPSQFKQDVKFKMALCT